MQSEPGAAIVYFSFALAFYREGLPTLYLIIVFSLGILIIASILISPNTLFIIFSLVAAILIFLNKRKIKRDKSILITVVGVWLLCVGVQKIGVPLIFNKVLKPHQIVRILSTFGKDDYKFSSEERTTEINKEFAKLGTTKKKPGEKIESYNVKQSKIAIGSGGFWGKGFLQGTQTKYDFVPEQSTDFIFCTVGEEWGFVGSLVVVGLYLFLLLRIIFIAERQRSSFSRIYGYGVASILFCHFFLNLGMTMGLVPVIGIPLPFISYGGSSLWGFTLLLFILLRLDANRMGII